MIKKRAEVSKTTLFLGSIWYFFAESKAFPTLLLVTSLVIAGMAIERAW